MHLADPNIVPLIALELGAGASEFFNNLFRNGYLTQYGQLMPKAAIHPIKILNIEKGYPFIPLNVMMRSGNHYTFNTLAAVYKTPTLVWTGEGGAR